MMCSRKAAWVAFGLVALAAISSYGQGVGVQDVSSAASETSSTGLLVAPSSTPTPGLGNRAEGKDSSTKDEEQSAEAFRAYRQAIATLSSLTAHPPPHAYDPSFSSGSNSKSFISSFLPNPQGQGPIGSALRIILKLHHSFQRITSGLGKEGLGLGSKRRDEELRGKAIKVMDLLQHSAELGNSDALFAMGKIALFPPTPHFNLDPQLAFDSFFRHAAQTGYAGSQAFLAFFYATGYRDIVLLDQAKAQLYYTFAANGGDKGAQMALGYRFWSGIGTSEKCQRAMVWYELAAQQAMEKFALGPPGGRTLLQTSTRLSDLVGGVYGPGASVASTGPNAQRPAIKAGLARTAGETWEDVLEYYLFNADRGETDFAYRLGKIYYQGSIYASPGGIASGSEGVGAIPRNYQRALHYFLSIARQVWPRDPLNPLQYQHTKLNREEGGPVGYAAASAAYIGRMYLRGEGVKQDVATAKMWFERGMEQGDRECQNSLGIIYRDGLLPGSKPDLKTALTYFTAAAAQELAEAEVNLAKYHYSRGEIQHATAFFESAVRHGSPFEAYFYLGEVYTSQVSSPDMLSHHISSSCAMAVSFHKLVAERGAWDDDIMREAEIAWQSGTDQGKEVAMLKWWIAAERGIEIAQNNLAFVLDQDKSILRLTRFSPTISSNETARLALTQWTRAAAQRNIDALVKVGDYYYHGLGVSEDETDASRLEKAARYYQSAADTQLSALAMWNLGWMYENGVGVPQDFHLAKRHYDLALETNSEAYLPVLLSLGRLYLRSIWHTLKGGEGGLSIWAYDEDEIELQSPPIADTRELDDGRQEGNKDAVLEDDRFYDDDDGPWYFGKAREDYSRKHRDTQKGRPTENEDPVQWARDRRTAEQERDNDFGPEDYFEGALRGGHREEDADDFRETMLLVFLCCLVSVLLYIRTRIVDRMRRDQQRQQEQQAVGGQQPERRDGLFPGPGDPARDEWAILR
ncbi:HCP-like protein [Pluteus cervinus]|uniref:HCP-like protein n=1 Tax=Pluteus cervinus TaxID=181527 RepID=A0ACD3B845_9AGAR|nr:HCP-like protein [Pluteus cervinus]